MFESFSFSHPALLGGLAVLAVPLLVHLLMRPRPRRVLFPALLLMHAALSSGQRASRTRNVLLMLVRAAVLAGAVLLLASPTCRRIAADHGATGPIAGAIVVDDSLSMSYRPRFDDGPTLLDLTYRQARAELDSSRAWPPGSRLAVVRAGAAERAAGLTADRPELLADLSAPEGHPPHARPLGSAIRVAGRLLRDARPLSPRLVVLTDLSASAWRDVRPAMLSGIEGLSVRVIGPLAEPRSNITLSSVTGPVGPHPAPSDVTLRIGIAATGLDAQCWLTAMREETVLARAGPIRVAAGGRTETALSLPAMPEGVHAVTVQLDPEDLLSVDQRRYVVWQNRPRPLVWLLTPGGSAADDDLSILIFKNLLAPRTLAPQQQRVSVRTVRSDDLAGLLPTPGDASDQIDQRPAAILVFPGVQLSAAELEALRAAAEAGTTLLLACDSTTRQPDWPGLRETLCQAATLDAASSSGTTIQWEPAASGLLSEAVRLELARCRVYRRIELSGLLAEVTTNASYLDGRPAIVTRSLGRGRVIALTTSPDPLWSEMGVRAAGLMSFLHQVVRKAVGPTTAAASFSAGQAAVAVLPALSRGGLVRVTPITPPPREPTWVRLTDGAPEPSWPTEQAGIYAIHASGRAEAAALYAVNWPAEEFDLAPIDQAGLVRALGADNVVIESTGQSRAGGLPGPSGRLGVFDDPALGLGGLIMLLFVVEMILAARHRGIGG